MGSPKLRAVLVVELEQGGRMELAQLGLCLWQTHYHAWKESTCEAAIPTEKGHVKYYWLFQLMKDSNPPLTDARLENFHSFSFHFRHMNFIFFAVTKPKIVLMNSSRHLKIETLEISRGFCSRHLTFSTFKNCLKPRDEIKY